MLAYDAQRAAFKIETREWADGNPDLGDAIERARRAAEDLMDCVEEIKLTASEIESNNDDLYDRTLWEEQ